jgi:hypothetical protein
MSKLHKHIERILMIAFVCLAIYFTVVACSNAGITLDSIIQTIGW